MFLYFFKLLQVPLELQKAAETSAVAGVLVGVIVLLVPTVIFLFLKYSKSQENIVEIQKEHAQEITKKENERNKQWLESEKETLNVLNGVSGILEMSEKIGQNDTNKILERIKNAEERITQQIESLKKTNNG